MAFVPFDDVDWKIGAEYDVLMMGIRITIGVLEKVDRYGTHVSSVTFYRDTDKTRHTHGIFCKTFSYREVSHEIGFLCNDQVTLVPTIHVKHTLIPKSVMDCIYDIIRAADAVFFESVDQQGPTVNAGRPLMKDTYTDAEVRQLAVLFGQHTGCSISAEDLAGKTTAVLILPEKVLCSKNEIMDNVLLQFARDQGKDVLALDTTPVPIDAVTEAIQKLPEYTFAEAYNSIVNASFRLKKSIDKYHYTPAPDTRDPFGLLEARNLRWKETIEQYRAAHPDRRIAVCAGGMHIFAGARLVHDVQWTTCTTR